MWKNLLSPNLLLASLLTFSGVASALDSDRKQPVSLEADSAVMDEAKGHHIYSGNVVVTQGSMIIQADSIEIFMDANNNIDRFLAKGNSTTQAHLKQTAESDKSVLEAWADDLVYNVTKDVIILTGQAALHQHGNQFSGDKIHYSVADEQVQATAKPNTKQRVKMIFNPGS
ncbi:MAG: lipopolysaccharide transport periplasmic protein LptA [Gammaproteobacteria bacterium]|jgi:lipopolysaccharide export system protein LptA|nr:lipopolysaccharide transport periplasmic protein LptA [Gammaproteobacteria bacterium]